MKILALASLALLLQANGCEQPAPAPASKASPPYQRFVPIPAPQSGMMGVPWTGYFALDTKTGQICLTAEKHVPPNFEDLPTCVVLTMTNPDSK
jgi:hypothetical protein